MDIAINLTIPSVYRNVLEDCLSEFQEHVIGGLEDCCEDSTVFSWGVIALKFIGCVQGQLIQIDNGKKTE